MGNENRLCKKCVMDSSVPSIVFDKSGICNYCHAVEPRLKAIEYSESELERNLVSLKEKIQRSARGSYDCVLGLSGGVDSSYMAYVAGKIGLKPLTITVDNGWDTDIAVQNVNAIVNKLGFNLKKITLEPVEFKDMQRSFLAASVPDIEMLTDHAIAATLIKTARKNDIKYILSGTNVATESGFPKAWMWNKYDYTNIKSIHDKYGTVKIKTYPTFTTFQKYINNITRKFEFVELLNMVNYRKPKAMAILSSEFGWQDYGGKHYESIFTRFYQAYILPVKFGIDKRKVHLSSQIRTGDLTRDEALLQLKANPYKAEDLDRDKKEVLEKLGYTNEEFDRLMKMPVKSHLDYDSDEHFLNSMRAIKNVFFSKSRHNI